MNKQDQQTLNLAWQVRDWNTLSEVKLNELNGKKNSIQNAVKIAIAHYQLGNIKEAKYFVDWTKDKGVDETLLSRYLLSGVYHAFAQAKWINGQPDAMIDQIDMAVSIVEGSKAPQPDWLVQARLDQCKKVVSKGSSSHSKKAKILNTLDLGEAWAGNTINTVIFRHQGIFTYQGQQFTAFYVDEFTLRIIKRDLKTNQYEKYDLIGEYNIKDAHNTISLGIDRQGYLHMSYDHHSNRLNYRRSIEPLNIQCWTETLTMTGMNEERVTYPAFILPTEHTPLLMLYRDGNWKKGTAYLKYYDEDLKQWFDMPSPILSGAGQQPWTSNAYWNHPAMDSNGILHLSYTWRTDYFSDEQLINNINVDYAKSFDGGYNWVTSKNQPYKMPITPTNTETVWPVSPGSNHINQTSMALDSKGHPHIVFYSNDKEGTPQYQHIWFTGKEWRHSYVSQCRIPFTLQGGGTLEIPISRPEIVIDEEDTVYVIYRTMETGQKLVASYQIAPDYKCSPEQTLVLWDESVGQAEPIIDRVRWQKEQVLSFVVENTDQPNGDVGINSHYQPILIIDIKFT